MIRTLLGYKNLDLTKDINERLVDLIPKGIFSGGDVVPVPLQLQVTLSPWKVINKDGMVAEETSDTSILDCPAGQETVIAVKVVYYPNDVPIVEVVTYEKNLFDNLPDVEDHVVFAVVDVPVGAGQVETSHITLEERDIIDALGRSPFRGVISNASSLPQKDQKIGDFYIVANGLDIPNIYSWSGLNWEVLTDFVQLSDTLVKHRSNVFSNEKHLTDTEKDAVKGTSGTAVSDLNRLVDNADTRLPTQNENNALVGSHGVPSTSNKYVTEEFPLAVPTFNIKNPPPSGTDFTLASIEGPFYVGNGGVNSHLQYFSLFHLTENREYLQADGSTISITGIFKDSGYNDELTNPGSELPTVVDENGFYIGGALYFRLSDIPTLGFRLGFSKRELFGDFPVDALLRNASNTAVSNQEVIAKFEELSGRSFDSTTPALEQNTQLRNDVKDLRQYSATSFKADYVVSDFSRAKKVPDFDGDFQENIGIDLKYTFTNSTLSPFTLGNGGVLTYTGAVDLSSVQNGNVFVDGREQEFKIINVDDGLNQLTLRNRDNTIPKYVSPNISSSIHGSCKEDNNPRRINLSLLQPIKGREAVHVKTILPKEGEFHPETRNIAYEIASPVRSDVLKEPRICLYGGFQGRTLPNGDEQVYLKNEGRIIVTGLFEEFHMLTLLTSLSPSVDVYLNGQFHSTVDLSSNNPVSFDSTTKYKSVKIADGLTANTLYTVELVINNSANDFVLLGFEFVHVNNSNLKILPGRAFVQTDLYKSDNIENITIDSVAPLQRGKVFAKYVDRNAVQQTAFRNMEDIDGTVDAPTGSAVSGNPNFTVDSGGLTKLQKFAVDDIVRIVTSTQEETKKIIDISSPVVTFSSNVNISGPATLVHIGSTNSESLDPICESFRVHPDEMGLLQDPSEFAVTPAPVVNRLGVLEDEYTSFSGFGIQFTSTNLDGADKAITLNNASSHFRFNGVFTSVDLLAANASIITSQISIDGSEFFSINLGGEGLTKHTLLTNARYQEHEIIIKNASGLEIAGIIFYEPHLDFNIDGAKIATVHQLATYSTSNPVAGGYISGDNTPIGSLCIDAFKGPVNFFDGTGFGNPWVTSLDFVQSPYYGRYTSASLEQSYFEFEITASGFEVEYVAGPDRGFCQITLNGTPATNTNFPGVFRGINSGTGVVDMYAPTIQRRRFAITNIVANKYVVKGQVPSPQQKNISSTNFFINIVRFYIVNQNGLISYSYTKSDRTNELIARNGLRDERNFDNGLITFIPKNVERATFSRDGYVTIGFDSSDDYTSNGIDDEVLFQDAFNFIASSTSFRKVIIKPGNYNFSNGITAFANTEIEALPGVNINRVSGPLTWLTVGGSNVKINGFNFKTSGYTVAIDCDSKEDLSIVNVQYDFGQIINEDPATILNLGYDRLLNIGDCVSSFLSSAQYLALKGPKWALLAGQDVTGSLYHQITGRNTLPNGHEMVLKMLPSSGPLQPGDYQADQNKSHSHGVTDPGHAHGYSGGQVAVPGTGVAGLTGTTAAGYANSTSTSSTNVSINFDGGSEVRVKTIQCNFFCKIN